MEFSWEWDPGPIGATTTDGAVIVSAARVEDTITHTPATIRGTHRMADTHPITGRRITANRRITADTHRITAENRHITEGNHQIMVAANRRTTVGVSRPIMVAVVVANRPAEVGVVNLLAAGVVGVNRPAVV